MSSSSYHTLRNSYAPPHKVFSPVYHAAPSEVRTIFVIGFPEDVQERELNNLLRFLPGYTASQMTWKAGQAQGFAIFETSSQARAALQMVNQVQFDEFSILRAEMARKDMRIPDDASLKRTRVSEPSVSMFGYAETLAAVATGTNATTMRDNPPCSTLYIGNLSDNLSETELYDVFGKQPGFKQMKVSSGAKGPNCFVEFVDIATAMSAHQMLQGAVLQSSNPDGIRVQFSKNPLGQKRSNFY